MMINSVIGVLCNGNLDLKAQLHVYRTDDNENFNIIINWSNTKFIVEHENYELGYTNILIKLLYSIDLEFTEIVKMSVTENEIVLMYPIKELLSFEAGLICAFNELHELTENYSIVFKDKKFFIVPWSNLEDGDSSSLIGTEHVNFQLDDD
jgi:hypothetical protein